MSDNPLRLFARVSVEKGGWCVMFLFAVFLSACRSKSSLSPAEPLIIPTDTLKPPTQYPTQACPQIEAAQLELRLNPLHQVIVHWAVFGGCAPYHGIITAWYQDEFKPYAAYVVSAASGQLLDAPILHRGIWDIDYNLEVSDGGGHSIKTMQTIGVGR